MRRRSPPKSDASVALFPFLAVLLCTMGSLILLLIVIARQAQQQAAALAAGPSDLQQIAQTDLEDLQWMASQLRESRDKTAAQLADERMKLSHIEDHARRLRDQIAELGAAAEKLLQSDQVDQKGREQKLAELAKLNVKLVKAKVELENALAANKGTTEAYAIIPFNGKNGTRRRPIYIECRADGVFLQPEGIKLVEEDFMLAGTPVNPLATCLRAAREYFLRKRQLDNSTGEPYPLLLVRPDGIVPYWVAREAMTSWGDDFGYELIDQDWKLDFPAKDTGLETCLKLAVAEARRQQVLLVQQAPRLYRDMAAPSFRGDEYKNWVRKGKGRSDDGPPGMGSRGRRRGAGGSGDPNDPDSGQVADVTHDGRYSVNPYAAITNAAAAGNSAPYQGGPNGVGTPGTPNSVGGPYAGGPPNGLGSPYVAGGAYAPGGRYGAAGQTNLLGPSVGGGGPNASAAGFSTSGSGGNGFGSPGGTGNYGSPGNAGGPGGAYAMGSPNGVPGGTSLYGTGVGGIPGGGNGMSGGMPGGSGGMQGSGGTGGPGSSGPAFPGQGGDSMLAGGNGGNGGPGGAPGAMGGGSAGANGAQGSGAPGANGGTGSSMAGSGSAGSSAAGNSSMGQSGGGANSVTMAGNAPNGLPMGINLGNSQGDGPANASQQTYRGDPSANNALASAGTPSGASNWGQNRASQSGAATSAYAPDSDKVQPGLYRPGAASSKGNPGVAAGSQTSGDAQANYVRRNGAVQGGSQASGGKTPSGSSMGNTNDDDDNTTKHRRKNWGLRGATHAVAVSRPVLMECHADHLTIVSDRPGGRGKIVPLDGRTSDSVDELVSGVWEQIDTWGMAGNNMYWKPTLNVQVYPGGEKRYAELQSLLSDSGLDLKQRTTPIAPPRPTIAPRPQLASPLPYPTTSTPY